MALENRALPHADVDAALRCIAEADALGSTTFALRPLVSTACRSREVRLARWSEFDLKNAVWTIAEKRTKGGRVHRMPLTLGEHTSPKRAKDG